MFRSVASKSVRQVTKTSLRNHSTKHAELPPWALEPAFKLEPAKGKAFIEAIEAEKHHAKQTSSLWRKISYFIAAPALAATAINTYFVEAEHAKHREHLAHVPDSEWPADYEFQNIRTKNFFWGDGDKTLFWNPVINRHIKHE